MNEENISGWVEKAKANASGSNAGSSESSVKVIRNEPQKNRGAVIIEIAEKLLPAFRSFFKDHRDKNGVLLQPSHVRGIALNYAEYLVKAKEKETVAA